MTIESILGAIVIGLVVGALGRLLLPGRQPIGILLTIVVGIAAALLGSAIVGNLRDTDGIDWLEVLVQIALAVVGVALVAQLRGGRRGRGLGGRRTSARRGL